MWNIVLTKINNILNAHHITSGPAVSSKVRRLAPDKLELAMRLGMNLYPPSCTARPQLFVIAKTLTGGQEFLKVQENVKIAGSKIRAVGRMIKQLSAKFPQNSCCASSHMWTSIVPKKHNTCMKHSTPLVLNGTS
ncbi:hypothetical protein TNCV_321831 [Trichonephila clavipes]|nr:hypothetical protein TNCV_321831 [Trichonephila clavipes]